MRKFISVLCILFLLIGCGKQTQPNDIPIVHYRNDVNISLAAHLENFDPNVLILKMSDTGSMKPLLDTDDIVAVSKRISFDSLKKGDVITYSPAWSSGKMVTHMCYRNKGDSWEMYGINNERIDPEYMTRDNYVGKVIKIYTKRYWRLLKLWYSLWY